MPKIELKTLIKADVEICFDLSRSIDLHKISTAKTSEQAIDGCTSGLIGSGEFVTWRATHFGVTQKLTSKITQFERPFYFRDEQVEGAFNSIIHDHFFEVYSEGVVMRDVFEFKSPYGILGLVADKFVLTRYLTKLLTERNDVIKHYAESGKWRQVLPPDHS